MYYNYRFTITFGNLYFTKENFGSKYFKILIITYKLKFYMLKVILVLYYL